MTRDRTIARKTNDVEVTKALKVAANPLDEMALEKALSPDAQNARNLCHEVLERMAKSEMSGLIDAEIKKFAMYESIRETDQLSKDRQKD